MKNTKSVLTDQISAVIFAGFFGYFYSFTFYGNGKLK